jgi:hypothetical protein
MFRVEEQAKKETSMKHSFLFDPEDVGDMFLRNVSSLSMDYAEYIPELFITTTVRTSKPTPFISVLSSASRVFCPRDLHLATIACTFPLLLLLIPPLLLLLLLLLILLLLLLILLLLLLILFRGDQCNTFFGNFFSLTFLQYDHKISDPYLSSLSLMMQHPLFFIMFNFSCHLKTPS